MNLKINQFKPSAKSFKNTFCVFNELDVKEIENLTLSYKSESGSQYYYTEMGMYRLSNHWGRLANSKWRLIAMKPETSSKYKLGFAKWDSFYPDNNFDMLYYIEANFEDKTVTYQHKNNPNFNTETIVRTSIETTKRIKQIRNLFELTNWAKYFDSDIDDLRFKIINQLISTNKTLEEIKKEYI
ncbi:hypothetical protein [Flavobacterium sp.]|uniref:hypothetical protein n=1 Tax=Flavobacterium sp. TaxID=239 RepID=UPI00286D780F|nr:hypothetical protein [Flavobacterium sp.]